MKDSLPADSVPSIGRNVDPGLSAKKGKGRGRGKGGSPAKQ